MTDSNSLLLLVFGAYLVGSLSFAVIVSRVMGLDDPRTYGSQNPGATNVLRSGNRQAAIYTLALDALKGYVPVLLVKLLGSSFGWDERALALVAISAFIGHLWPVFFGFRGGKGVASRASLGRLSVTLMSWSLGLFPREPIHTPLNHHRVRHKYSVKLMQSS